MPEWVRDTSGTALKTTDAMLDHFGPIAKKREATLRQIELWRETAPEMEVAWDDLEVHLR